MPIPQTRSQRIIIGFILFGTIAVMGITSMLILLASKQRVFEYATAAHTITATPVAFPVGVDPVTKTITPNPEVSAFVTTTLTLEGPHWWQSLSAVLAHQAWYQQLASPVSRIAVIWPGERREQIMTNIGGVLGWNQTEQREFATHVAAAHPYLVEGTFFPDHYVVHKDATPQEIAALVQARFTTEITARYTPDVEAKVPLTDALIIASLIEREARDWSDMQLISGIIWNRLFIDMPLQLDATLQYVKATTAKSGSWWPVVRPSDKFATSPFNTYIHSGLPPTPIASPSLAAVVAALNPAPTPCLFYFHDARRNFHCSTTYEEHKAKLAEYY
jgi:cell division protein YceG involved in septum cleavage